MKKIYTLMLLGFFALGVQAQLPEVFTFEEGLADTTWISFANGTDTLIPTLSIVPNPQAIDPNTSDSVLQFIVKDDANEWVGMYTDHVEVMVFSEESHSISMMVLKSIISPLLMKFELSLTGAENFSLYMDNTLTDEWELMVFDLSGAIPHYFQRLTIFPDFPATRESGTTVYIDNIGTYELNTAVFEQSSGLSLKLYPNPVQDKMAVQYPEMKGITVSDMQGKTLKSFAFQMTDSKVIELSDLQTGTYIVTAETGNGNYSGTFIKK
ncbi:MAG: T9SS type A sorting domain-containing protein [Bacteroidota bacterium]